MHLLSCREVHLLLCQLFPTKPSYIIHPLEAWRMGHAGSTLANVFARQTSPLHGHVFGAGRYQFSNPVCTHEAPPAIPGLESRILSAT